MDAAYMEKNRRELEIVKHISLAMLDPRQLVSLRETGACEFTIPEILFDLDFPGHYKRRIRSVSVTIPCVTGPHTSVSATLSLTSNQWRPQPDPAPIAPATIPFSVAYPSIATSSAQGDAGVFELNFRDERYLPFEGAGAISEWKLELPGTVRQFDYDTISDVILHMSYTAVDGGKELVNGGPETFKDAVVAHVKDALSAWLDGVDGLYRIVSLRQEFPAALRQLLNPPADAAVYATTITLEQKHFPYVVRGRTLAAVGASAIIKTRSDHQADREHFQADINVEHSPVVLTRGTARPAGLTVDEEWGGLPAATVSFETLVPRPSPLGDWTVTIDPAALSERVTTPDRRRVRAELIEDILLAVNYEVV